MKNFLERRRGQVVRLIVELNPQKQPIHYYEGEIITVGEDSIVLRDPHLGEVAVNPEKITAVQVLNAQATPRPSPEG